MTVGDLRRILDRVSDNLPLAFSSGARGDLTVDLGVNVAIRDVTTIQIADPDSKGREVAAFAGKTGKLEMAERTGQVVLFYR